MFHLGFSISMSIRSLGCQSQLRGHYWQYRDARVCLTVSDSVCQSEANFSFVWPVRRGRLVVWRSLLCPWSVLCLLCQCCRLWCAAAFPRAVELTIDCVSKDCRFMPPQIRTSSYQSGFQFRWCITTGRTCINPYRHRTYIRIDGLFIISSIHGLSFDPTHHLNWSSLAGCPGQLVQLLLPDVSSKVPLGWNTRGSKEGWEIEN